MAEHEDSAQVGPAEGGERNIAFDPEGAYCQLINHRRPPDSISHFVMPPKARKEIAIRLRNLDAEFWRIVIEKLDYATQDGKISRGLAAQLAIALRRGCAGQLPASWAPLERSEQTSSAIWPRLEDQRLGAVMYRYTADLFTDKEDSLFDPAPVQTIIERCGINKRTWSDWSGWLRDNRNHVEMELETLLLQTSFILESLEDLRCALLFKRDAGS